MRDVLHCMVCYHLACHGMNRWTAVSGSMACPWAHQGHGMDVVALPNVCSTLLCYARCVFYGTLSRLQGLIIHWLVSLLPRQQASTAAHVPGRQPSGAVLIGFWNSSMHPILRDFCLQMSAGGQGLLSLAACTRARTPGKTACLPSSQVLLLAPSRWPSTRRIKARWELISMPTLAPRTKSKQTRGHGPASVD